MASKRNESITSYFQPAGEAKGKSKGKPDTEGAKPDDPWTSTESTEVNAQTKGKGKRPMSTSPPAPTVKRPNTSTTNTKQPKHLSYTDLPSSWLQDAPSSSPDATPKTLKLTHHQGNIFTAPPNTLLIHACNTQGHWGAGIAKAFKTLYPKAYLAHHSFCAQQHNPKTKPVPTGTAQLLAPVDGNSEHWIGCVFTSAKYGKAKDKPEQILRNTLGSVEMLLELVRVASEERVGDADGDGEGVKVVRMCKINSGKFGVPWERTEEVLKGIVVREGWVEEVEVWEPRDD